MAKEQGVLAKSSGHVFQIGFINISWLLRPGQLDRYEAFIFGEFQPKPWDLT